MGYNRGDSFPFDFNQMESIWFRKSKGKLSPRSYPIQCERKWKQFSQYRHTIGSGLEKCALATWEAVPFGMLSSRRSPGPPSAPQYRGAVMFGELQGAP